MCWTYGGDGLVSAAHMLPFGEARANRCRAVDLELFRRGGKFRMFSCGRTGAGLLHDEFASSRRPPPPTPHPPVGDEPVHGASAAQWPDVQPLFLSQPIVSYK